MRPGNFNEYKDMVDVTALIDFCRDNGKLCHYGKGETIVQQGSVGKYCGVVESGYFKYTTITTDGAEAVVGFAFEGDVYVISITLFMVFLRKLLLWQDAKPMFGRSISRQ